MRIYSPYVLLLVATLMLPFLGGERLIGQEETKPEKEQQVAMPDEVAAFDLQHIDAADAMQIIVRFAQRTQIAGNTEAPLFGKMVRMTPAPNNPRTLICVSSNQESLEQVREFLKLIDKPAQRKKQPKPVVFHLQNVPAEQAAAALINFFGGRSSTNGLDAITPDANTNSIYVSCSDDSTLESIKLMVAELDKQPAELPSPMGQTNLNNCRIQVTWAVAAEKRDTELAEHTRKLPARYDDLVNEIRRQQSEMGELKELTSVSSVGTQTEGRGTSFDNMSKKAISGRPYSLSINGLVQTSGKDKYVLEIAARLGIAGEESQTKTTLSLPDSHPVAFSISDYNGLRSVIIVEVQGMD